jgi:hypothetical protein
MLSTDIFCSDLISRCALSVKINVLQMLLIVWSLFSKTRYIINETERNKRNKENDIEE